MCSLALGSVSCSAHLFVDFYDEALAIVLSVMQLKKSIHSFSSNEEQILYKAFALLRGSACYVVMKLQDKFCSMWINQVCGAQPKPHSMTDSLEKSIALQWRGTAEQNWGIRVLHLFTRR